MVTIVALYARGLNHENVQNITNAKANQKQSKDWQSKEINKWPTTQEFPNELGWSIFADSVIMGETMRGSS